MQDTPWPHQTYSPIAIIPRILRIRGNIDSEWFECTRHQIGRCPFEILWGRREVGGAAVGAMSSSLRETDKPNDGSVYHISETGHWSRLAKIEGGS